MKKEILKIAGMHCAGCANGISSLLAAKEGIMKAEVNYANESAVVEYDENRISLEEIVSAVKSIGYEVMEDDGKKKP